MNSQVLLFFVTGIVAIEAGNSAAVFTCYPNSTIVVFNPDSAIYDEIYAEQVSDYTICTVNMDGSGDVTITGCSLDQSILVHFTNRTSDPTADDILGGATSINYIIECAEIDSSGVDVTRSNDLGITLVTESSVSVTPSFSIDSVLLSGIFPVSSASVGDTLSWEITIPDEYFLTVTSCTAYAGKFSGVQGKAIIADGCSLDTSLVGDFDSGVVAGDFKTYSSSFYVFKFYNNDYVYLECDLKICPSSASCPEGCSITRKRSVLSEDDTAAYAKTSDLIHIINSPLQSNASRLVFLVAITCKNSFVYSAFGCKSGGRYKSCENKSGRSFLYFKDHETCISVRGDQDDGDGEQLSPVCVGFFASLLFAFLM